MDRKNQVTENIPSNNRNDKPSAKKAKDENEVVAEAEQVIDMDKESFADRNHKRKHDSPADVSNPGTV
ncbi:hypothetical protein SAMN05660226_01275 [Parapedobacter luteus]|uniref:Uncharacterized protein n=1 Tax=Parapedobacter luteus TaxID=623280 RepID=A0A1T5B1S8_9SPHI|nr:hypothetical protein [Parapedobacter luteus]SKB41261.1 hypothetical protein SAMN05660226_01275 [Parapedobacter luteus]